MKDHGDLVSNHENADDSERLARLVRLAARAFNRSLQIRLSTEGVSFGQWIFLRILWSEEGVSQRDLSQKANLTEPTTHTALLRMEELGLITRRNVDGNKRKLHAFLTKKGRRARQVLEPLALEVNNISVEGLTEDEVLVLRRALVTVIRNLERDEDRLAELGQRIPPTRPPIQS